MCGYIINNERNINMNNIPLIGLGLNGNKVVRPMVQVKEQVLSETADRFGSLIKALGSADAFADIMLYKPFYQDKLRLKRGELPVWGGIKVAFEIINKDYFPKTKKDEAIKFLSDLANRMKEVEQNIIKEANKKDSVWSKSFIEEEILPAHKKEMANYAEQAEKMVKLGKLDSNPFA